MHQRSGSGLTLTFALSQDEKQLQIFAFRHRDGFEWFGEFEELGVGLLHELNTTAFCNFDPFAMGDLKLLITTFPKGKACDEICLVLQRRPTPEEEVLNLKTELRTNILPVLTTTEEKVKELDDDLDEVYARVDDVEEDLKFFGPRITHTEHNVKKMKGRVLALEEGLDSIGKDTKTWAKRISDLEEDIGDIKNRDESNIEHALDICIRDIKRELAKQHDDVVETRSLSMDEQKNTSKKLDALKNGLSSLQDSLFAIEKRLEFRIKDGENCVDKTEDDLAVIRTDLENISLSLKDTDATTKSLRQDLDELKATCRLATHDNDKNFEDVWSHVKLTRKNFLKTVSRVANLEERIEERFGNQEHTTRASFQHLEKRLDGLSESMKKLLNGVDENNVRFNDEDLEAILSRISMLEENGTTPDIRENLEAVWLRIETHTSANDSIRKEVSFLKQAIKETNDSKNAQIRALKKQLATITEENRRVAEHQTRKFNELRDHVTRSNEHHTSLNVSLEKRVASLETPSHPFAVLKVNEGRVPSSQEYNTNDQKDVQYLMSAFHRAVLSSCGMTLGDEVLWNDYVKKSLHEEAAEDEMRRCVCSRIWNRLFDLLSKGDAVLYIDQEKPWTYCFRYIPSEGKVIVELCK